MSNPRTSIIRVGPNIPPTGLHYQRDTPEFKCIASAINLALDMMNEKEAMKILRFNMRLADRSGPEDLRLYGIPGNQTTRPFVDELFKSFGRVFPEILVDDYMPSDESSDTYGKVESSTGPVMCLNGRTVTGMVAAYETALQNPEDSQRFLDFQVLVALSIVREILQIIVLFLRNRNLNISGCLESHFFGGIIETFKNPLEGDLQAGFICVIRTDAEAWNIPPGIVNKIIRERRFPKNFKRATFAAPLQLNLVDGRPGPMAPERPEGDYRAMIRSDPRKRESLHDEHNTGRVELVSEILQLYENQPGAATAVRAGTISTITVALSDLTLSKNTKKYYGY